jgi:hypothetical protein
MPGDSSAVPTEDRVGLNHLQASPPTGPEAVQQNPQEPVAAVEAQATRRVLLENSSACRAARVRKLETTKAKRATKRELIVVATMISRMIGTPVFSERAEFSVATGSGEPMDLNKLGQQVIRPVVEAIRLDWYGWHGFRRGIASNLYELGANEKIVQRILRHAKPHVTSERYIKAFDPAVLAAMKNLEATLDALDQSVQHECSR